MLDSDQEPKTQQRAHYVPVLCCDSCGRKTHVAQKGKSTQDKAGGTANHVGYT